MTDVRSELPPTPTRIALLPVHRGYPVPHFVAWTDGADPPTELPVGEGAPDFRILRAGAVARSHNDRRCWICGQPRGVWGAFVGGPMCAISRTSAEPPSHRECAEWAVRACPFLVRPHMKRREGGLPEDATMPGIGIMRNPGASFVWVTRIYFPFGDGKGGVLFRMGDPESVEWYAEGRPATRGEVEASVESGLPLLREVAEAQPGGVDQLDREVAAFERLLPEDLGEAPGGVSNGSDAARDGERAQTAAVGVAGSSPVLSITELVEGGAHVGADGATHAGSPLACVACTVLHELAPGPGRDG